jgi:hypothetical protein
MFLYHIQINCIRIRIQKKLVGDEPTNLRNMLLLVCNLNCGHYSMLHVFCHVLMYLKVLKKLHRSPIGLWEGMFQGSLRSSATLLQAANGGCDATGRKTWSRCFLSYSTCCWFITGTYRNYFSKKCLHQSVSGCSRGLNCIFCSISVSRYVSSCCQHSSLYTRTS